AAAAGKSPAAGRARPPGPGGGVATVHGRGDGPRHRGRLREIPLMTEAFRTTRRVEFVDTDMAGIVHFSNFFRWMESAEVEFLRARGLSVNFRWEGRKIGFPRVSASCDFVKPVTFGDEVEIAVRVARVGRKSVTYAFEFS